MEGNKQACIDKLATIGIAVAAVGLLAIQLFVESDRLRGATGEHIANISFLTLSVVCALLLAYRASVKRRK